MALHYGMQTKNIPAGVMCLSGYLLKSTPLTNYKKLPINIMHGEDDSVIK
jgi:predicted esterase